MADYDKPMSLMYNFANQDLAAGAGPYTLKLGGPAGKQGKLREVGIVTTEATVWTSTAATIEVGSASDANAYASLSIPTSTGNNAVINTADDTDAIIAADIAADACVIITLTEGTGGSITGQGYPYVIIDWF